MIGSKLITYENASPMRYQVLLIKRHVKYVEDIVVTGDMEKPGMSRKEVIQVISGIVRESFYVQAENHLDYLTRGNQLSNMKRLCWVTKTQARNIERSQIYVS